MQWLSVALLLPAIAVVQLYGQARNEQDRDAADAAIGRIGAGVAEQGARLLEQGNQLRDLTVAVTDLADQGEDI